MKLIIGLGNPGAKYEKTRHNLGFMVVEQFLKDFEPVGKTEWEDSAKFKADITELEWKPKRGKLKKVILVKPKTYMNNSGMSVGLISKFYKVDSQNIIIVHDEIDLPLGAMKIRIGGSSAGHKGVESILSSLGTEKFWRIRIGIGKKKGPSVKGQEESKTKMARQKLANVEDYVLGRFTGAEWGKAKKLIKHGSQALREILENGPESAQHKFNTK